MFNLKFTSGFCLTSCCFFFLSSCTTPHIADDPNMPTAFDHALESTAITYGAQNGLAWQALNINDICHKHAHMLDQIYNFNGLILPRNLMPPVLQESKHSYHQEGFDTIRLADKIIEIVMPAGFVTSAPTWRSYLLLHYQKPQKPHNTLLPTTKAERALWDQKVNEGWYKGVEQANYMFEAALGRLNRDFKGMTLYHSLVHQGMISKPYTATTQGLIKGNDQKIRINDKIIRITEHSKLQTHQSKQWTPAVINHD